MEDIRVKIENILNAKLGTKFNHYVSHRQGCLGTKYLKVWISTGTYLINGVQDQEPDAVSLSLDEDMQLNTQCYGGCGGGRVFFEPDRNDPKQKYLAMHGINVPFRKPKATEASVLKAIEKFVDGYLVLLRTNREKLLYGKYVDYDTILS